MRFRPGAWPLDRCRDCGMPFRDADLYARLVAWTAGFRCMRCRQGASTRRKAVVVAASEEQQNPFALFIPEDTLNRSGRVAAGEERVTPVPPQQRKPVQFPAAAPARSLVLAFGLGLALGAGPAWLQEANRSSAASTALAVEDSNAPFGVGAAGGIFAGGARPRAKFATDRFLPPETTRETTARSAEGASPVAARRAAPRAPAIPTVRYPGTTPAAFRGTLAVDTTPSGALVSLDGTQLGSTPLRIENVPAGSHVLRLEAAGRRASASAIQVVANRTTRVTRALEPTP